MSSKLVAIQNSNPALHRGLLLSHPELKRTLGLIIKRSMALATRTLYDMLAEALFKRLAESA